ncbi:hypothetical protein KP509_32G049000 [Ceratopteris richardii]|nr:hypothetical protein KP509_32G049000 [Ceratopteris richardii]
MFSTSMVSEVDDEGHYLSSADAELLSEPLPSHRSLLADYSPVANRRTPSPGRKLLQDYSPTPNQRSLPSPPNKRKLLSFVYEIDNQQSRQLLPNTFRKLLQDYGPMANRRSPSTHRKLLQAHMNMD